MAHARVSSLLDRFKYEQRPNKKMKRLSDESENWNSGGNKSFKPVNKESPTVELSRPRPSTPESEVITCIPETPTSELPESIESGSPVFPSSSSRNAAKFSQRSKAGAAISSLICDRDDACTSPTFGRSGTSKKTGQPKGRSNFQSSFRSFIQDSDSNSSLDSCASTSGDTNSNSSAKIISKAAKTVRNNTESDSTHITNTGAEDSLETVSYSWEESSQSRRSGSMKRKMSDLSSDEGDDEEKQRGKEEKDAMEQLKICFPHKSNKQLQDALEAVDWNVNQAANNIMLDTDGSPPRRKSRISPETKKTGSTASDRTLSKFQAAGMSNGWIEKPTNSSKKKDAPKSSRRKLESSSDESDEDEDSRKKDHPSAKTFQRIRTLSEDSIEELPPVDVRKKRQRIRQMSEDSVDDELPRWKSPKKRVQRIRTLSGDDGDDGDDNGDIRKNPKAVAKKSALPNGRENNGKKFRRVWCGFLSSEDDNSPANKKKSGKAAKADNSKPKVQSRRFSESEEDDYDSDGSDYDEGDEEVSPEFQAMAESFFNDASSEELTTIEGCSKAKSEKIISMRPFTDFNDLLERLDETKGLGSHLVWNCEAVFEERRIMEELMGRCAEISERIQATVTAVLLSNRDDNDCDDGRLDGQITRQPALLNDNMSLKPYQLIGLNWLNLMYTQQVNGILADEMGLGKTIQVISFLAHLLEEGKRGPHVIVAPSSTMENWIRELHKWCPALEVVHYCGSQEERQELRDHLLYSRASCNVIVTSYNMSINTPEDRSVFRKLPLQYAIFDEGHMLKNMKSNRYTHLMKIKAKRRLLLTGTPLQNNLPELISLLSFTLPDLFGGKTAELTRVFSMKKQKSDNPHEQSSYEMERINHAKQIMQPFVLRRIKADVLKQLPKKMEKVEHPPMLEAQAKGYRQLITTLSRKFKSSESRSDGKMSTSMMMMELRKQANHPLLLRRHYDDKKLKKMAHLMLKEPTHYDANPDLILEDMQVMSDYELHRLCHEYGILAEYRLEPELITESGKFRWLDKELAELKEQGSRVLLFSQFTMVLDIVEEYLRIRHHKHLRLDGQTPVPERAHLIDKFNEDDSVFIFLVSTKAGGVGINLTAANTVIIHDIDFNPYNDKQAEDRCHRVGQTRDVTVIRLVSKNTIEEGMLACATYKLKLEQQMTSGISGSSKEDSDVESKDIARLLRDALDL